MKSKLLVLAFLLFSLSAQALVGSDQEPEICGYVKKHSLAGLTNTFFHKDTSEGLKLLVNEVSGELDKRNEKACQNKASWDVASYDNCSHECVTRGSSETRVKALIVTKGVIDLNQKTRDCQLLCRVYMRSAYAYVEGVKQGKEAGEDCSEGVSSADRSNQKDVSASEKKDLKKSSATKQ